MKALDKVAGETRLIEMNVVIGRCDVPREMSSQKPFNSVHKIDVNELRENALKLVFHIGALGEEHKVVNVETKRERYRGGGVRIIVWIADVAGIDTGIVRVGSESH